LLARLKGDVEALQVFGPSEGVALSRLWGLDPLGAALCEPIEKSDRELTVYAMALTIVVVEDAGMTRDWLIEYLDRRLAELPPVD